MPNHNPETDDLRRACRAVVVGLAEDEAPPVGDSVGAAVAYRTKDAMGYRAGIAQYGEKSYGAVFTREEWGYRAESDGTHRFFSFNFAFRQDEIDRARQSEE